MVLWMGTFLILTLRREAWEGRWGLKQQEKKGGGGGCGGRVEKAGKIKGGRAGGWEIRKKRVRPNFDCRED